MADFSINISKKSTPEYTVTANTLFDIDGCITPLTTEYPVGLIQNTATLTPEYYLLSAYTDASSWKTLKIKNVVYSNGLNFYLSDTSVKIPEAGATVYDFDVTGQAVDIAIPNFTVTTDAYNLTSATITFDLAIENLASEIDAYTTVTIMASKTNCITPVSDLIVAMIQDDACGIQNDVNVFVPSEGERYVVVTSNDAFGSTSDTTAGETITTETMYSLIIDASDTGTPYSEYSTVILLVYNNSSMSTLIDSWSITRNHQGIIC